MKLAFTQHFAKEYKKLSAQLQKQVDKSLRLLMENSSHHSTRFKKMSGINIWEIRVNKSYRITLQIEDSTYLLRRVGTHDILKNP